jgi:ABC-type protease/lipase transport system fused ATPase/permease subunit
VSDAQLLEALRLSCLDETLSQMPNGLGTQVGERGDRLSGGQRQAVSIARALVQQPRMLLLDEPSSMMDPATEARLIDNLRSIKGITMLLVTHRMAMLPLVDRLVVLDQGRVVMDGPRNEVLRKLQGGPAPGRPPGGRSMKLQMKPTQPRIEAEAISSHPDFDRGPRKAVLILLATTALFFVLLFAWMSFAPSTSRSTPRAR